MFGLKSLTCVRLSSVHKLGEISGRRTLNLVAKTLIGKHVISSGSINVMSSGFSPSNSFPRNLSISEHNVGIVEGKNPIQAIKIETEYLVVEKQWDNDFNAELDRTLVESLGSYSALQLKDTLKELEQMNVSAQQFSPELVSVLRLSFLFNLKELLETEHLGNIIQS